MNNKIHLRGIKRNGSIELFSATEKVTRDKRSEKCRDIYTRMHSNDVSSVTPEERNLFLEHGQWLRPYTTK